jgi:hypothetical protein
LGALVAGSAGAGVWLVFAQRHNRIAYEWRALLMMAAPLAAAPAVTALHAAGIVPYGPTLAVKVLLVATFLYVGRRMGYLTASRLHAAIAVLRGRLRPS